MRERLLIFGTRKGSVDHTGAISLKLYTIVAPCFGGGVNPDISICAWRNLLSPSEESSSVFPKQKRMVFSFAKLGQHFVADDKKRKMVLRNKPQDRQFLRRDHRLQVCLMLEQIRMVLRGTQGRFSYLVQQKFAPIFQLEQPLSMEKEREICFAGGSSPSRNLLRGKISREEDLAPEVEELLVLDPKMGQNSMNFPDFRAFESEFETPPPESCSRSGPTFQKSSFAK